MQNKTIDVWLVICHGFIISIFQLTIQQLSITNDEEWILIGDLIVELPLGDPIVELSLGDPIVELLLGDPIVELPLDDPIVELLLGGPKRFAVFQNCHFIQQSLLSNILVANTSQQIQYKFLAMLWPSLKYIK